MRLLELLRRMKGSLFGARSDADLEEELRLHLQLAAEAEARRGASPEDARRAARLRAGAVPQALEGFRDQRGLPSLDALAADVVFGWRQLRRHPTASAAAILSLGLAIGATMAAFRLVDAVLLRPLPVADPSRLFVVSTTFHDDAAERWDDRDDFDYPTYRKYVNLAGAHADLMVVGFAARRSIRIGSQDPEPAVSQYVSGNVFSTLGVQPALGRLLGAGDDVTPDGHPVAVISYDFWQRRFGGDAAVVGRTFRLGDRVTEIVGVTARDFTGTEPGALTDLFLPAMMNAVALERKGWSWFRIWVRPKPGVDPQQVQSILHASFHADHVEGARSIPPDMPRARLDAYLSEQLVLRPAGSGASGLQKIFRRPLWILAALAALLLLIACANVANLLLARAMSRRVEMALRLSIGAGRGRLVQLMLVESGMLALLSAAVGGLFASWAAPVVVSMLAPAERPVGLVLGVDWRTLVVATGITFAVTMLFGLVPALRASAVTPINALKETRERRDSRRLTHILVASQMAFCVFLLVGASLFVGTFDRLVNKPLGFAPENLVHMSVETRGSVTRSVEWWTQLAASLREIPRVESAAVASWAPLTGNRWRSAVIVDGKVPPPNSPYWVSVAPGYFETMQMRILDGRGFRAGDETPSTDAARSTPGVAVVNEAFARVYFDGRSPVGRRVIVKSSSAPVEIVGVTVDAVYFSVREPLHPVVYVPLEPRYGATLLVRTADGAVGPQLLRTELPKRQPGIVVRETTPFDALVTQQMIRERLLAALSSFFAVLALLLALIGMYGVLSYAVTRERREIGLRMALGARPEHIVALITTRWVAVVFAGALAGVMAGLTFGHTVRMLLFEIQPTDPVALAGPIALLLVATAAAALPPLLRAVRIDPAATIRTEG
jgi:putative ABC transport system permease protein